MKKKKRFLLILFIILFFVSVVIILNIKVITRQGINYQWHTIKIPLYLKILDFYDRHFNYKYLVKKITKNAKSEKEKVIKLFEWTHKNIRKVPEGFPIVDDHILNIIIRGYGTNDQSADVFCMLCEYVGIPAGWVFISPESTGHKSPTIVVSIVKLGGQWKLFDTYFGNYFTNENGEIASLDDLIANPNLVNQAKHRPIIKGVEYHRYFSDLKDISDKDLWKRGKIQMPLYRLMYAVKRLLKKK